MQKLIHYTDVHCQTSCGASESPKIAVFLNGISNHYPSALCEAVARQAEELGFSVLFFASNVRNIVDEHNEGELKLFTLPDMSSFEGIIVVTSTLASAKAVLYIQKALPAAAPVVSIGPPIGGSYCVESADNGCMEALIRHFIAEHGFTRINFISGTPGNPDAEYRLGAYKKLMAEYGLGYEGRIFAGDFTRECAKEAIAQFIKDGGDLPEAIVCANDAMALGAYAELARRGLRVPEDIALSGYDCIRDAARHVPRITTVRQPLPEMGSRAVQIINAVITGARAEKEYKYNSQVVIAGSCGCADAAPMQESQFIKELLLDAEDMRIYNYISTSMMELLTGAYTLHDIADQLKVLARLLAFRHLYFCVDEDSLANHTQNQGGYPEEMTLVLGITGGEIYSGLKFKTRDILPALDKDPSALVFAPLYYKNSSFGYIAFDFDRSSNNMHRIWVKNVSLALENLSTQNALKQYAVDLEEISIHDPLTGVLNRRGLEKAAHTLLNADTQDMLYVIYADLDGLKRINDVYGHAEGDEAIKVAADILRHCARPGSIIARMGGDEFVCVGLAPSEETLHSILFSIQSYGKLHNEHSGKPYAVNASYGWYLQPRDEKLSLLKMIDKADNNLYEQKRLGTRL